MDALQVVVGIVLPVLLIIVMVFINERGFEYLVAKPLVDQYAKQYKALQPYLVLGVAALLSFGLNVDIVSIFNKLYPLLNVDPVIGKLITTVLVGLLSMQRHDSLPATTS